MGEKLTEKPFKSVRKFAPKAPEPAQLKVAKDPSPKPKKFKLGHKKFYACVVALLIALFGGGATIFSHLNNKPEKVIADAFVNTLGDIAQKRPVAVTGTGSFTPQGSQLLTIKSNFSGVTNQDNGQFKVEPTVEFAGKRYPLKVDVNFANNQELYFKVQDLAKATGQLSSTQPLLGAYMSSAETLIAKLDNHWVKVTKDDLKSSTGANTVLTDKCTQAIQSLQLSSSDKAQLKKVYKQNQPLTVQALASEKVLGHASFHYKVELNNEAAKEFAKQLAAIESLKPAATSCGLASLQNLSFNQDSTMELWINKSSRRINRAYLATKEMAVTVNFAEASNTRSDNGSVKPQDSIPFSEIKAEFEKLTTTMSGL